MDLAPFMTTAVHTCPRCYRTSMVGAHRVRYCERLCLPAVGGFVNGTHVGSTPSPHLHVWCPECQFEWLMECAGV
jgi:hypothetical protein